MSLVAERVCVGNRPCQIFGPNSIIVFKFPVGPRTGHLSPEERTEFLESLYQCSACGQCHVVPGDLFAKSRHAGAFAQMGVPGCATCHDNHDIKPTSDAMVGLGDKAVCTSCHDDAYNLTATATDVDGNVVAEGEFTAAIIDRENGNPKDSTPASGASKHD